MANLGHFLGGMADARDARLERGLKERALGIEEQGLGLKKRSLSLDEKKLEAASVKERVAAAIQNIQEITNLATEAKANSRDGAPKVIAGMRSQIETTASLLDGMSDLVTAEDILGRFDAAVTSTPTALQAATLEGEAAGAKTTAALPAETAAAKAKAKASAEGAAAGTPEKPMTDAGKAIFDQALVEKQFGVDSPQAKAFKEAAESGDEASLSDVGGVRKEFTKASSDFVKVRDAFGKIAAAGTDPSPAGDLALMFNYMKMLDPGSVVRESEFAQIAATGAFGQRLQAAAQRFINGERLAPEQRQDFIDRAEDLMRVQLRNQISLENQFRGIAERNKMDPKDVVIDLVGEYRQAMPNAGGAGGSKPKVIKYDLQGNRIQ